MSIHSELLTASLKEVAVSFLLHILVRFLVGHGRILLPDAVPFPFAASVLAVAVCDGTPSFPCKREWLEQRVNFDLSPGKSFWDDAHLAGEIRESGPPLVNRVTARRCVVGVCPRGYPTQAERQVVCKQKTPEATETEVHM